MAPAQLRMAKLSLSMHTMSPAVRMFDQVATQNNAKDVQCDTFVAIGLHKVCDNDALRDILKNYNNFKAVSSITFYFFLLFESSPFITIIMLYQHSLKYVKLTPPSHLGLLYHFLAGMATCYFHLFL